ncbi:MAG: AraC family transcriptional regulator [Candidatus Devosia phytovorans]|uniref:AraC family transcriptional regulator n=1 Tax=Candidatus Devosia phytovorans TaxID=3121372 RepID=A0AAJ5VSU1_9HYPH|nr:AraC family transcriptional regulator [Devosia sp.]WEK03657.1 MAG: AraC family transcriptional regulator [Devosia sp.]
MSFMPEMSWYTEGITVLEPVRWRQFDGAMGAFWQAESQSGSRGYYLADDPRIMVYFNDVSSRVAMSNDGETAQRASRPMARAIYIPPGMPMWTSSEARHRFTHLNLHIHKDRLLRFLSPAVGRSSALSAIARPVELAEGGATEVLARMIVEELVSPRKPALYAESLMSSLFVGLLDIRPPETERAPGRLTSAQMRKLNSYMASSSAGRVSVADMAASVGLSESWFGNVFKHTTGQTPLQWQLQRRIDTSKALLQEADLTVAAIAARLGFTDQAHFTKAFRQTTGETPAAWRRLQNS